MRLFKHGSVEVIPEIGHLAKVYPRLLKGCERSGRGTLGHCLVFWKFFKCLKFNLTTPRIALTRQPPKSAPGLAIIFSVSCRCIMLVSSGLSSLGWVFTEIFPLIKVARFRSVILAARRRKPKGLNPSYQNAPNHDLWTGCRLRCGACREHLCRNQKMIDPGVSS